MVEGTATLIVDLGNSETRVTTYFGKTQRGNRRKVTSQLSNIFGRFGDEAEYQNIMNSQDYSDDDSRVFTLNGERYCTGKMQESEFGTNNIRPSGNVKKYDSIESKLALCNAFCQGYEDIARWTQSDLDSIDVVWNLTVLLPADDMEMGARAMANLARSIGELDFQMPEMRKELVIKHVTILPEGFCAFLGAAFEKFQVVREGYDKLFKKGTLTMIVDMGAGTTDLSIVNAGALITNSKYTEPIGGNNVEGKLRQIIRHMGIPRVSNARITEACKTGILRQGVKSYDVHEQLNIAKRDVADELVQMIKDYQDSSNTKIADISYVLVCGGGSTTNENDPQMKPITDYVLEFLHKASDGIELVDLPMIEVDGELVKASPRLLNVMGAGIASEGGMD